MSIPDHSSDAMCRWILALQELHEALRDIEANREALVARFGEAELNLLQITTQGSIHRMLGQLPETEGMRSVITKLDEIFRARGLTLTLKGGARNKGS